MTTISNNRNTEHGEPHWVEWATGLVSLVLVAGIITWVGYEAVTRSGERPRLSVSAIAVSDASGHQVDFKVTNAATTTAAAVVVRGEIIENGEPVETIDVTFDYVPAQSGADGTLIFAEPPGGREVRIRAVGFTDP